jgi:hypothetical protein
MDYSPDQIEKILIIDKARKDYYKRYYQANKEQFKLRAKLNGRKKIRCSCGLIIKYHAKHNHLKTKKHLFYLELNN